METLETIFLTVLWKDILEIVNEKNILQPQDMDIFVTMKHFELLKTDFQENRHRFSKQELYCRANSVYNDV